MIAGLNGYRQRVPNPRFEFALLTLFGYVVLLLVDSRPTSLSIDLILSLLVATLAAWNLAREVTRPEPRLFGATYWLFVFVALGVAPMAQASLHLFPPGRRNPDDLTTGLILVLGSSLVFALGQRTSTSPVVRPRTLRLMSSRRRNVIAWLALLCSALYVARLGGPSAFFLSRHARRLAEVNSTTTVQGSEVQSAIWGSVGTVPVLLALVLETSIRARARKTSNINDRVRITSLVIGNLVVNNPISNSRYWFLTCVGSLAFVWFGRRAWSLGKVILIATALALLVFPYADVTRRDSPTKVDVVSISHKLATKDYDQISMLANGISYVQANGFAFGRQTLGVIGFAVPRSTWSSKPIDTGVLVGNWIQEQTNIGTTNLSSPLWLEWYLDFGAVPCVLLFGLLGRLVRSLDRRYASIEEIAVEQSHGAPATSAASLLYPVFAAYSLILLRGPLLQATARGVMVILVASLFLANTRVMQRRSEVQNGTVVAG